MSTQAGPIDPATGEHWDMETFAAGDAAPAPVSVVLVSPKIPGNSGAICRTCAAAGASFRLVGPMGFQVDDAKLKRAGLDYWKHVCAEIHTDWDAFTSWFEAQPEPKRLVAFTALAGAEKHDNPRGEGGFWAPGRFREGDLLLFGSEDTGLHQEAVDAAEASGGCVCIPMLGGRERVRSMNLSVCVAVGLFEALRQVGSSQQEAGTEEGSGAAALS